MKKGDKKAQVTAFVIIGIVIIALILLIYFLVPGIKKNNVETQTPYSFIQECVEQDLQEAVDVLSLQGGSINPENYVLYKGEEINYLCYTNEYYTPCVVQVPLIEAYIEREITQDLEEQIEFCFNSLTENYEKKGYIVSLEEGDIEVELLPKRIVVKAKNNLTLNKESVQNFDDFNIVLNNNLYELTSIAYSIISWETEYGDAETTLYMDIYHDLKVEKHKESDGTTIYILTDRNTENKFQFASRSFAYPPGLSMNYDE